MTFQPAGSFWNTQKGVAACRQFDTFKLILDAEQAADFTKGCPHRLKVSTDTITKVGYSHGTSRWRSMSRRYSTQFMSIYCTYSDCVIGQRLIGLRPVYYSKFATIWINLS